jgi:hypothetical protein
VGFDPALLCQVSCTLLCTLRCLHCSGLTNMPAWQHLWSLPMSAAGRMLWLDCSVHFQDPETCLCCQAGVVWCRTSQAVSCNGVTSLESCVRTFMYHRLRAHACSLVRTTHCLCIQGLLGRALQQFDLLHSAAADQPATQGPLHFCCRRQGYVVILA